MCACIYVHIPLSLTSKSKQNFWRNINGLVMSTHTHTLVKSTWTLDTNTLQMHVLCGVRIFPHIHRTSFLNMYIWCSFFLYDESYINEQRVYLDVILEIAIIHDNWNKKKKLALATPLLWTYIRVLQRRKDRMLSKEIVNKINALNGKVVLSE